MIKLMRGNILILTLILYFLTIFQTSFLIHFKFLNQFPSLILILVFLLNLFEKKEKNSGFISAFLGGFFWDIFSHHFIGFHIILLVLFAIFIKFVLKKQFQPIIKLNHKPASYG